MHDIKIKSLSTDLDKIKSKYDKTIYENLQVPGYIGPGCQYKSISEYITNNIFEFSKIKNNIDQMKIENIEVKNRLDNILKSTLNLIDSSVVRCQKYSDNKHQDMQKIPVLHLHLLYLREPFYHLPFLYE
jgi:seryl-tRNA synthetase